ncbi:LysR family transcriptional regulator [Sphingobium sp. SYK-6]|uniref:LysR family transcriptional regulator n=1 Tax=Sphingobium sp. (strain NBRC 103272 / SYK-6) TaxID=627192 RepID=UPI00022775A0|nr:LysR family transcriptional regulator [Sphingobium sp. SYK-6]BAK67808.1 LysR family transcriptional regulator [Sphingobium sp. SYK-6]
MDIRELRSFIHVARLGSVNRAAMHLNIAQPALSRQLQKLEETLGVRLFTRSGRGVDLTEAGALLLGQAEQLINQFDATAELVSGRVHRAQGHVTVGLPPTCGLLIGPELFRRFREQWPNATLILREGISSSLEEWLVDRRIDIAVMHNPLPMVGVEIEPLLHEHMVLLSPPDASIADEIRLRDISRLPLILPALPHSNRRLVERAVAQNGGRLSIVAEVDSVPFVKELVKRGYGHTIQTHAGAAREEADGTLCLRPIRRPQLVSTLALGVTSGGPQNWLASETAQLVRTIIRSLVERQEWIGARMMDQAD